MGIERDHIHQLGRALAAAFFIPAQHARHHGNVLLNGHIGEQADLLDNVADIAPQSHGILRAGIFAVDGDFSAGRRD